MYIQNYQIHNVLNVCRRQLSRKKTEHSKEAETPENKSDSVNISEKGRNQSIMEKVTANVLKKIKNLPSNLDVGPKVIRQMRQKKSEIIGGLKENKFIFNTIDKNNLKKTRSIAVDDLKKLMNQLDKLPMAVVNQNNNEEPNSFQRKDRETEKQL